MKQIPVYKYPASQAAENNELDQYRASRKANIACKEAIEAAIREHYRDNRLGIEAVNQVLEEFGMERMMYVLANTVKQKDWDARFSPDNKAWAATVMIPPNPDPWGTDRNCYFVVDSHPGLTDLFLKQARRVQQDLEKKPSVRDKLKPAPDTNRTTSPKKHTQER